MADFASRHGNWAKSVKCDISRTMMSWVLKFSGLFCFYDTYTWKNFPKKCSSGRLHGLDDLTWNYPH